MLDFGVWVQGSGFGVGRVPGSRCRLSRRGGGQTRKVDTRLPGKWNPNSHGARPVHQIISMTKWIRTKVLSIKYYVSLGVVGCQVLDVGFRGEEVPEGDPLPVVQNPYLPKGKHLKGFQDDYLRMLEYTQ